VGTIGILAILVREAVRFYVLGRFLTLRVAWPVLRDLALVPALALGFLWAIERSAGGLIEWLLLLAVFAIAAWAVRVGGFWRRWLPWFPRKETAFTVLLDACRSLFMLTAAFSALALVLHEHGWLTSRPTAVTAWSVLGYYGWHFFDSIPALDVPQTLNWSLATHFTDHRSGFLLLAYKLLVIFPVVGAVFELLHRRQESPTEAGPRKEDLADVAMRLGEGTPSSSVRSPGPHGQ